MSAQLSELLALSYAGAVEEWDVVWQSTASMRWTPIGIPPLIDAAIFGDGGMLWARWFLEGIADPDLYKRRGLKLAVLYKAVSNELDLLGIPDDKDGRQVRVTITMLLWREVQRRQNIPLRHTFDKETKEAIWQEAEPDPRCWICGYKFLDETKVRFLRSKQRALPLRAFVDFYRPCGLKPKDLWATVEHVGPLSRGGGEEVENLRLGCMWCNEVKSHYGLMHEVPVAPLDFVHPRLGRCKRPHPFWVVRRLALVGRCETSGCQKTTKNSELTVTLRHLFGAPTPANLRVTCGEHDNLSGNDRYVAATAF